MAATECTVRLRPVPSTASQAAILEELQARGLLAYLGSLGLRGASDPFEDPSNTTVFVADLYFGAAGQAKAAAPFLGSFAFLGGTTTASLLKGTNGLSNLHQLLLPTGASPTSTPPRTPPSSNGLPGHLKPPSAGTVQIDKKATCAPVPIPPKSDETAARNGVVSSPANGQLNFSNGSWAHDQVGLQSLRGEKRGLPEKEAPQGEPQNRETRAVSPLSSGQGVAKVSLGQGLQGSSDATQQPSQEEIREGASENASASAASSATVTKYTADQTVAVEPVPAGVSMEALLEELKRALADIDSRNRSDLARGLQNCSQALTDPRGDAPFAYLNFRDAVDAREAAVLLSRAVLFNQRVRAVVKSNFVGQVSGQCYVGHGRGLRQVDEAGYKQAGILLYR